MQQRAALGEERNIESNREPVHDGAELPECRGGITCFVGKPDKVSRSMQLEQACSLFARPDDGPLKAKPSLVVIALRLPEAAAQPIDFRKVHFLVGGFGQVFGFIEVRAGLFELVCAQLIFGELCQIARQKKRAAAFSPKGYSALNIRQTAFFVAEFE
jgi:hypothetical protein